MHDNRPRCLNCEMDLTDYEEAVHEWGFCGSECEREYNDRHQPDREPSMTNAPLRELMIVAFTRCSAPAEGCYACDKGYSCAFNHPEEFRWDWLAIAKALHALIEKSGVPWGEWVNDPANYEAIDRACLDHAWVAEECCGEPSWFKVTESIDPQ